MSEEKEKEKAIDYLLELVDKFNSYKMEQDEVQEEFWKTMWELRKKIL